MREEIAKALELAQRGDEAGLDAALSALQDTIFSFSMRVCGQRQDAEDTMQEVLLKSVPNLQRFESPRALAVWLYKVAKTRCLMSRRRSKFAPLPDLSLTELMPDAKEMARLRSGDSINPESLAMRSEAAARLRQAIQKLPPPYRIVLVLRDMEGLSDEDVAEITGLRAGTVRVRLHRARLFVRKELSKAAKSGGGAKAWAAEARPAGCKAMFAALSEYLDEKLDDHLCEELEQHMQGCAPCEAFLASLQTTIEQCRALPAECAPGKKAARLRRQILQEHQRAVAAVRASL